MTIQNERPVIRNEMRHQRVTLTKYVLIAQLRLALLKRRDEWGGNLFARSIDEKRVAAGGANRFLVGVFEAAQWTAEHVK